jgi:hypothetical protein
MVNFRQSLYATEGVISGGVTIEGNALKQRPRKINKRLKRELNELRKDLMKEVKKNA